MNKTCSVGLLSFSLCAGAAHANLIANGDFQTGALGPSTSAYAFSTTMSAAETYNVVSYNTIHSAWVDMYDHTFGDTSGRYMIINGSDSGVGPTWSQSVVLQPNTEYTLTHWMASLYSGAYATVEWRIIGSGTIVSPKVTAPTTLGQWADYAYTFNSGSETNVTIQLWETAGAYSGNDYALDDIELAPVPTPGAIVLLGLGGLVAVRRRR